MKLHFFLDQNQSHLGLFQKSILVNARLFEQIPSDYFQNLSNYLYKTNLVVKELQFILF